MTKKKKKKKKTSLQCESILILFTKRRGHNVFLVFQTKHFTSSHFLTLFLFTLSIAASHLSPPFFCPTAWRAKQSAKDTEGRGAPLPAPDLGAFVSWKQDCLWVKKTAPLRLMARKTQSARCVIWRLHLLRPHLCINISWLITDLQLRNTFPLSAAASLRFKVWIIQICISFLSSLVYIYSEKNAESVRLTLADTLRHSIVALTLQSKSDAWACSQRLNEQTWVYIRLTCVCVCVRARARVCKVGVAFTAII